MGFQLWVGRSTRKRPTRMSRSGTTSIGGMRPTSPRRGSSTRPLSWSVMGMCMVGSRWGVGFTIAGSRISPRTRQRGVGGSGRAMKLSQAGQAVALRPKPSRAGGDAAPISGLLSRNRPGSAEGGEEGLCRTAHIVSLTQFRVRPSRWVRDGECRVRGALVNTAPPYSPSDAGGVTRKERGKGVP